MKKLLLVLSLTCSCLVSAQTPQLFNYQAVMRDSDGSILANQNVSIQISILSGSKDGHVEYRENHFATTNQYGLVTLKVGAGDLIIGDLSTIDWSLNPYFLQVNVDITGGMNFISMGTSQLLSVPYALFAENVRNLNDQDNDSLNEIQQLSILNDTIILSRGGYIPISDLNKSDYDSDPTNEFQELSISEDTIYLSNGGFIVLPTSNHIEDSDTTDEIQFLTQNSDTIFLSKGGFVILPSTNLDADSDSLNEIQFISLKNDSIFLSHNGGNIKLPRDEDSDSTNEIELPANPSNGDILYFDGTNWQLLPIGENGQQLIIDGGRPAWKKPTQILTSENNINYELAVDSNGNIITTPLNLDYYITISSPNIGSLSKTGSFLSILWNDNIDEDLSIELYRNNSYHLTISDNTESDGQYKWLIHDTITSSTSFSVLLKSVERDSIFAQSQLFTIVEPDFDHTFSSGSLPVGWVNEGVGWHINDQHGIDDSYSLQSGEYIMNDIATISFSRIYNSDGIFQFHLEHLYGGGIFTLYIDNDFSLCITDFVLWREVRVWIPAGNHTFKFETVRTSNSTQSEATSIDNIAFLDGESQLEIGTYYQGGVIIDINSQKDHGLIASCYDLDDAGDYTFRWGCDGQNILSGNGAESENDGYANTLAILTDCVTAEPALICSNFAVTVLGITYDDWYLPSINELILIQNQSGFVDGFEPHPHWSSSESGNNYSWAQIGSSKVESKKISQMYVRAIRTF